MKLRKSSTLRFSGQCLLEILRDFDRNLFHVALFTKEQPPRLIVKWQIDHIRQYGSNDVAFKFQSGRWGHLPRATWLSYLALSNPSSSPPRKAPTGVDWFILDTEPGVAMRIHRAVDYWAQHIVEQVANMQGRGTSLVSPPLTNKLLLTLSSPTATPSPQALVPHVSLALSLHPILRWQQPSWPDIHRPSQRNEKYPICL